MFGALFDDHLANGTTAIPYPEFPIWLHYAMALIIFFVAVFSVVGNFLTFLILNRQTKYSRHIKIYRIQLALSHIISPLATYWMYIISSLHGSWVFGQIGCSLYGFVQGFCALLSILLFAAIAFNRASSLRTLSTASLNKTIGNSVVLWIIAFALTSPPLFGWNRYVIDGLGTTCCFDLHSDDTASRTFVMYILLLGFLVPLAIIVLSYRKVFLILLNSAMFQKRTMLRNTGQETEYHAFSHVVGDIPDLKRRVSTLGLILRVETVWRERRRFQHFIRPVKTMLLATACFLCAWLPYAVLAILQQFVSLHSTLEPYVVAAAGLVAKSYVAFDPIVYVLTDEIFREEMFKFLGRTKPINV